MEEWHKEPAKTQRFTEAPGFFLLQIIFRAGKTEQREMEQGNVKG